jgi:hypothetical protein
LKDLKAVYVVPSEAIAIDHRDNIQKKWENKYPLAVKPDQSLGKRKEQVKSDPLMRWQLKVSPSLALL